MTRTRKGTTASKSKKKRSKQDDKDETKSDDEKEKAAVAVAPPTKVPKTDVNNDAVKNAVSSANALVASGTTVSTSSVKDGKNPTITDMSNLATVKVTRLLPNFDSMDLEDESRYFVVTFLQFYAMARQFMVIYEIARDWFEKASRPDSSVDADGVVITVCDNLNEVLLSVAKIGANQHVPTKTAKMVCFPAVEAATGRATAALTNDITSSSQAPTRADARIIDEANMLNIRESSVAVMGDPNATTLANYSPASRSG